MPIGRCNASLELSIWCKKTITFCEQTTLNAQDRCHQVLSLAKHSIQSNDSISTARAFAEGLRADGEHAGSCERFGRDGDDERSGPTGKESEG